MRIVYALTSLGVGGAERQVLALAARMAERGHAVALMVLRPRLAEEWTTTLPLVHLDMRRSPLSVLASVVRGRRFLKGFWPECPQSQFSCQLCSAAAEDTGSCTSGSFDNSNVYEGGRARMLAYRLTDGLSWRTAAVSAAVAERFVRLKAVPQNKIVVVTNGIDTGRVRSSGGAACTNASGHGIGRRVHLADGGTDCARQGLPEPVAGFCKREDGLPNCAALDCG